MIITDRSSNFKRPQNALFDINTDPTAALHLTGRVITLASWLAAVARRELSRFKEFIAWVRFGKIRAQDS